MSTFYKKSDLEYSDLKEAELDYKTVTDILGKTDQDNTYQLMMEKEKNILNAVNGIVKTYQDHELNETQFINMKLSFITNRFFVVLQEIIQDLISKKYTVETFTKDDRLFYVGIFIVLICIIAYIF